jgi:methyl-accepting chemotaxis protein
VAENFSRQRLAEQEVRARAQSVIDDTSTAVLSELQDVVAQADAVRVAAGEIDARAGEADTVTRLVVAKAEEADRVVVAVNESLRRVGGIAQLIAGVAEQTNLLALNATIEAARAGDAGKGFSVVASEVKGLAAETGRSTTEIATTVGTLESDAAAMAATIAAMSQGVGGMGEATARVSEVAARQRASVERLDQCVHEAIARIEAMSKLTERLERRTAERVTIGSPASVRWGGQTYSCRLEDLSESGVRCLLETGSGPAEGSMISLTVTLGGGPLTLDAKVVRSTQARGRTEFAAAFSGLARQDGVQIRQYLDALVAA